MTAPAIIQDLVNRFRDSRELYRSGRYNEAQLRLEFLNPFFEALGWDMVNRSNFAPQYREVIHEDSLEVEGSAKAPDYAFRIGTTRKFFVEAKKPAVDIRYAIHPAYQLRRYAWNAHLPLSILTDFEELAVYDCRTRPDPKDSAATGRVMLFTFEEYVDRWDELAQIFARDAVWNGSFDRYAEGSKGKRGTTEVDAEFLKEIEEWRILLARNIALRNFRSSAAADPTPSREGNKGAKSPELAEGSGFQTVKASEAKQPPSLHRAERQLNYAVQTTIDRILFLRICEDRQIEPTDQLLQIAGGSDIYAHLLLLFQKADQKYNSGLFHFGKEKGQTSEPDTFTPTLVIDDKVLRQIIKSTYFPCPYIFNEIPVEILGQVYEQFLGKVIRLTPGGQAKVEEKPEVRKAGGVYYTPRYIVDYIVQNTLGRLLGDSTGVRTDSIHQETSSSHSTATNNPPPSSPSLRPKEGLEGVGGSRSLLGETGTNINGQQSGFVSFPPSNEGDGGTNPSFTPSREGEEGGGALGENAPEPHGTARITPSEEKEQVANPSSTPTWEPDQVAKPPEFAQGSGSYNLSKDGLMESIRPNPVLSADAGTNPTLTPTQALNSADHTPSREGGEGGGTVNLFQNEQMDTIRSTPALVEDAGTNQKLTPTQALNLRVVDPACGSGSFLLGAYQYLLDWHLNYYLSHDPQSHTRGKNPPLVAAEGGEYRLTTETKKRILTSNIYGVDIDAQAVEVTKLSLLLKLLEGETGQLSLGFERVLPDLGNNIRCGNSLIGWDYFKGQMFPDEEEIQRVNPFDWQRAFPHVFAEGGFDAVIGNPPYIRIQSIREWAPNDVDHYRKIYPSASTGNFDIYVIFVEKGLSLLNEHGLLGYILPHKFFQASFAAPIREIISQGNHLRKVVHFGAEQVFSNATTYTCLLFLSAQSNDSFKFTSIKSLDAIETVLKESDTGEPNPDYLSAPLPAPAFGGKEWHFSANSAHIVLDKLRQQPLTLGDITKKIFVGLQTSADKIYVLEKIEEREETVLCYSKSLQKEVEIERGLLKPFLMGKDVHRYEKPVAKNYVIFPYLIENPPAQLMSQSYIKQAYPAGWEYLLQNRKDLGARESGRMVGDQFYAYIYPKSLLEFKNNKIMTPDIAYGPQFTYDNSGLYHTTTVYSLLFNDDRKESPLYFLGILNSAVMWFFLSNTGNVMRGGYFRYKTNYLSPFPIPTINFSDPIKADKHSRMVDMVSRVLDLKKQNPNTPIDRTRDSEFIRLFEKEIDRLTYSLFNLNNWEIETLEDAIK